jgi:hypothetical protein
MPVIATMYLSLTTCKGDVDIYLKEGNNTDTSCENCTSFFCRADGTNVLTVLQDGILCISYQRNGLIKSYTCPGLSIEDSTVEADPTTPLLSVFTIKGRQCFDGGIRVVVIECVDAQLGSGRLQLRAHDSCESNQRSCHEFNCSDCVQMDINWWYPRCQYLENFAAENLTTVAVPVSVEHINIEVKYCVCEENTSDSLVLRGLNRCGKTTILTIIASCEYENGSDGINKSDTACDMCNSSETIVVISSSVFAVVFLVLVVLAVLTLMLIRHRKKVSCQEHCS